MISVLIPTRGRQAELLRTVESIRKTKVGRVEVICYVDEDDAATYFDKPPFGWIEETDGIHVRFECGPRIVLSNMWNKCADAAHPDSAILCQGNDDVIFRSKGWDKIVETEFEKCSDRILLVHGNDGGGPSRPSGRGEFGTHPFVHRQWVDAVGYFVPPYFSSDYGDTWLNDLANAVARRRYVPIIIEHIHFWLGKTVEDQNTRDRLERGNRDRVSQLYSDLEPLRQIDIEKLKAAMR